MSYEDMFEECARRLREGESVEAAVSRFPEHSESLRQDLASVEGLRGALVSGGEDVDSVAASHAWARVESGLRQTAAAQPMIAGIPFYQRVTQAGVVSVTVLLGGGALVSAANPGGIRSVVTDAVLPGEDSDVDADQAGDDLAGGGNGDGAGGSGPEGGSVSLEAAGALDVLETPITALTPLSPPSALVPEIETEPVPPLTPVSPVSALSPVSPISPLSPVSPVPAVSPVSPVSPETPDAP